MKFSYPLHPASAPNLSQAVQHAPIINPFPGKVWLERKLGHELPNSLASNEAMALTPAWDLSSINTEIHDLARLYPDPAAHALRECIASQKGIRPEELLVDAGADSLLLLFLRVRCNPGDVVVCTAGTYPTFAYFAKGLGLRIIEVAYDETAGYPQTDLAALAKAAQEHDASLVYLANPDNPSSTFYQDADVAKLREQLPQACLLMIDEAYLEFADAPISHHPLPASVRLRSFSKRYGLAGMRVGYAIAHASLLEAANQLRIHFAVSNVAQHIALKALKDDAYANQLLEQTCALRADIMARYRQLAWPIAPSATNFVCLRLSSIEQATSIQQYFWQQGIAIHRPSHPAVQHLLRITVHPLALDENFISQLQARM